MPTTNYKASQGEACLTSMPVNWPEGTGPRNPQASYYRARYYDPQVGRFVSEDPARFGGGLNVYAYVKNDPIDFIDPTGLKCWQSSPWTEIPTLSGPNGPAPYLTIEEGLFWISTGWSYASLGLDKTHCVCTWVADHTRKRKFYHVNVKEQAQFTCDCPASTYYETRNRTKDSEVDSPGQPILSLQTAFTIGATFQLGDTAGSNPNSKSNVTCGCLLKPPAP